MLRIEAFHSHSDALSRFLWFLLVPKAVVLCRTSGPGMRSIYSEWILKLFCYPDQLEKTERKKKGGKRKKSEEEWDGKVSGLHVLVCDLVKKVTGMQSGDWCS